MRWFLDQIEPARTQNGSNTCPQAELHMSAAPGVQSVGQSVGFSVHLVQRRRSAEWGGEPARRFSELSSKGGEGMERPPPPDPALQPLRQFMSSLMAVSPENTVAMWHASTSPAWQSVL